MNEDEEEQEAAAIAEALEQLPGVMSSFGNNWFRQDEPWPTDREEILQLIRDGKDPFRSRGIFNDETPYHQVSSTGDLELLLHMAARPGSPRKIRHLFCRDEEVEVPIHGRDCIAGASSCAGHFFHSGLSLEGYEVMVMFGYRVKQRDIEKLCGVVPHNPGFWNVLMFALAHACIFPKEESQEEFKLELCLGLAIGGDHLSFVEENRHSSIELARLLMDLGADPNGYCFQGETPYDFCPALYQAIKNDDEAMAKLLLEYGADPEVQAQETSWTDEGLLDVRAIPVREFAVERDREGWLEPPPSIKAVDGERKLSEIQSFITRPLLVKISGILVVAFMRTTGQPVPAGLTASITSFCDLLRMY